MFFFILFTLYQPHFAQKKKVPINDTKPSQRRKTSLLPSATAAAPEIKLPSQVVIFVGEDRRIPCESKGNPQPTVNWSVVGETQFLKNVYQDRKDLVISAATVKNSDVYMCVATNGFGQQFQLVEVIVEQVHRLPTAMLPVDKISILYGKNATLRCITTGYPTPNITWTFRNQPISNHNVHVLEDTLFIQSATSSNQGDYMCTAANDIGSSSVITQLYVYGFPPLFDVSPSKQSVLYGTPVTFRCEVSGIPQPDIHWYFRTDSGSPVHSDYLTISSDRQILTIVQALEPGVVYCIARNPFGHSFRKADLSVRMPSLIG